MLYNDFSTWITTAFQNLPSISTEFCKEWMNHGLKYFLFVRGFTHGALSKCLWFLEQFMLGQFDLHGRMLFMQATVHQYICKTLYLGNPGVDQFSGASFGLNLP